MKVSALVLNYRSPRATVVCVQALLAQTLHAGELEVIIVDNHSDTEAVQWLRNAFRNEQRVRIVETAKNLGFGQGYAQGAALARGDFLLINNPDKVLPKDGVERLLAIVEGHPDIGIVAPKLVHDDGTVRSSARAFPRPLDVIAKRTALGRLFPQRVRHYLQEDAPSDTLRDSDWVVGGCFLIPRNLFEELQGFDDRFFLFFEDIDLCRRVWEKGRRVVYAPDIVATDRKRRLSEGGVFELFTSTIGRIHIQSALRYFRKWHGSPLPVARTG